MRYILALFLFVIVSSSEIISKADEIKEVDEYKNVELKPLNEIIKDIGKIILALSNLRVEAKTFIIRTKIFLFIKDAIEIGSKFYKEGKDYISQGKALFQKSKIFQTSKKIFDIGRDIYNKYHRRHNCGRFPCREIIEKVTQKKIYLIYQKLRNVYNKTKNTYDEIKNYYKQYQDIYSQYLIKNKTQEKQQQAYQSQEKNGTQDYQAQQQRLKLLGNQKQERLMLQKSQAFQRYAQLRNNNTMTLATKQVEINNHLNYMLNKGFITPAQKQQMSNIQPPEQKK